MTLSNFSDLGCYFKVRNFKIQRLTFEIFNFYTSTFKVLNSKCKRFILKICVFETANLNDFLIEYKFGTSNFKVLNFEFQEFKFRIPKIYSSKFKILNFKIESFKLRISRFTARYPPLISNFGFFRGDLERDLQKSYGPLL